MTLGFLKKNLKRTKDSSGIGDSNSPVSSAGESPTSPGGWHESPSSHTLVSQTTPNTVLNNMHANDIRPSSSGVPPQQNPPTSAPKNPGQELHTAQALQSSDGNAANVNNNSAINSQMDGATSAGSLNSRNGARQTPAQAALGTSHQTPTIRQTKGKYSLGDFALKRTLGTGSFGRVHLVQSNHNQRYYAIKVLKKQQVVKMKQVEHTNDERRMLQKCKHPFLVTLWGTFQDSKNLYMVMDFVEGGELFSLLRKSQVGRLNFLISHLLQGRSTPLPRTSANGHNRGFPIR